MIKQWSKVIKLSLPDHQKITFFILFELNSIKKTLLIEGFLHFYRNFSIMPDSLQRQLKPDLYSTISLHASGLCGTNEPLRL